MPELPEVETVRRGLDVHLVGRRIEHVEVGRERTVRRTSRQALIDGLTGTTIVDTRRRGKYLLLGLDSGDDVMIHLRMSGRVLISPVDEPRPAHTHVVARLSGTPARELRFVDPRTFGEMVVFDPDNVAVEIPDLAALGVDPITDGMDRATWRRIVRGRSRQLKALLLDQHVIAGIGNIYCDEILHASRLRHDRISSTLSGREITALHREIHRILNAAIDAGGSTLADTQYVDIEGNGGQFQLSHRVYDRYGQRCLSCGRATIERVVTAGRSTHFCPRCQR
ncbi:MAG: bifunctional DNA-formamidopyrimidine glycosylase/DNA-(apurinic or apyrimidinic site) lyase [Actinobacteria bacterium]|nr:bifunctional DNA-formamidopyrimidine glycosylase/DNA-(apurinic or apyrimidinic site) lyase [Actinomycetota bacterium]